MSPAEVKNCLLVKVLAGGMAGMSQLASLYSELQQAPQKVDAPSCHQVDASSSNQLPSQQPADWEWATGPAQRLGRTPCAGRGPIHINGLSSQKQSHAGLGPSVEALDSLHTLTIVRLV